MDCENPVKNSQAKNRMNSFARMKFRRIIKALVLLSLVSIKVNAQEASDSAVVEEIVVFSTRGINPSGARYHLDGCRYLKNGQIKVDERQALNRGLLPCSVCLPDRASALPFLRTKNTESRPKAFRKCVFKTKTGAKCEREALPDHRYCELHKSRANKPKGRR